MADGTACTQPGCVGTTEDHYCNVCGTPSAEMGQGAGCGQPGCSGSIEDGYCDVCGTPSEEMGSVGSASVPSQGWSTHTTAGSSRLSTALIGSARAGGRRAGLTRPTRRIGSTLGGSHQLGAGITSIPPAPVPDPRAVVMSNPMVPEEKRFCASCGKPVGRSRDGKPGRTLGFCPNCRTEFAFDPKLKQGDVVGGQYEVVGALTHGGLGWIYLAQDRNVSDRWVVLKGLLNSGDIDAYQAAVAERQFLAEVQHPLIVNIYNFAMFEDAGYTVMEYVGGRSLTQLLKERMGANDGRVTPFPADQAIAYMVEILPAFGYLHSQGLLYCDFKPDNIIQAADAVKLIDLGGVRRVEDEESPIYGTVGFQAPEIASLGPSVPSDIFTIGRTLAVLLLDFRGYQSTYATTLPPVDATPLFQRYDSLYRTLAKATATDRNDRFQSADEFREQLIAVLREVVAMDGPGGPARQSTPSALFGPPTASGATLEWDDLPLLAIDQSDRAAAWLAGVSIDDPGQRLAVLDASPENTVEVQLARGRAAVESGHFTQAEEVIEQILADDPWEWRAIWLSGIAALARGDAPAGTTAFNTVLGQVPGELAPKLALAVACERCGERPLAQSLYRTCTIIDANYTAPAAFGLARTYLADDDVTSALAALDLVGQTSGAYVVARRTRAEVLANSGLGLNALSDAAASVENVPIDPRDRQQLAVKVLTAAIGEVQRTGPDARTRVAGVPATLRDLQLGAEQAYRALAALTPDRTERVRLVDEANSVRPRSLT
jgi:serine/threonine-protein kinase PknG